MKYVSPKYKYEVLETEDIMGISDLFGAIFDDKSDIDNNPDTTDVSVSVGVDKLLP